MLGAGMDSRPWRMKLPAGAPLRGEQSSYLPRCALRAAPQGCGPCCPATPASQPAHRPTLRLLRPLPADLRWYEVDRSDVIQAKQALLKSLKAEVPTEQEEEVGSPMSSGLAHTLRWAEVDRRGCSRRCQCQCCRWGALVAAAGCSAHLLLICLTIVF